MIDHPQPHQPSPLAWPLCFSQHNLAALDGSSPPPVPPGDSERRVDELCVVVAGGARGRGDAPGDRCGAGAGRASVPQGAHLAPKASPPLFSPSITDDAAVWLDGCGRAWRRSCVPAGQNGLAGHCRRSAAAQSRQAAPPGSWHHAPQSPQWLRAVSSFGKKRECALSR